MQLNYFEESILMEQRDMQIIEEMADGTECRKKFKCCSNEFTNVCRAKDIGIKSFLVCLEDKPQKCNFALTFADVYFCKCPVRVYIGKKLKI